MRKIKRSEIRETAMIMAECFKDYPLYDVFFENDDRREKRVFYFFWYRMYTRRDFSYINDSKSLVFSIKRPEDRQRSAVPLFLNPLFLFGFLRNIPLKSIRLTFEFSSFSERFQKLYYNPLTDVYAQAICVLEKDRGTGLLIDALKDFDDDRPVYMETHTTDNVRLYQHLGAKLMETSDFHGVTHYILKKKGSFIY